MKTLREIIVLTHHFYHRGQPLLDEVVEMYVGDLADLDQAEVLSAYERWRRNPANRVAPLPAQIRELVNPEEFVAVESQAREIAARIVGAVPKFGWNNAARARMYIGEAGWELVERQGGWQYICENLGHRINAATFQAQLRDLAEGSLRHGSHVIEQSIGALPERRARGELKSMADILKLIPAKPGSGGEAS